MKTDRVRDFTRSALLILCLILALVLAGFGLATSLAEQVRGIAEANPAYVRAQGEADILSAAADAVRADTRIATWAPVLLWLTLVGGVLINVLLAALAVYVWAAVAQKNKNRP